MLKRVIILLLFAALLSHCSNSFDTSSFYGDSSVDIGSNGSTSTGPVEINVKDPSNAAIASGGNYTFGDEMIAPTGPSKTFTIENTDTGTLSITGTNVSGTNSADFVVTSAPASSVNGNSNTTFVLRFAPTGVGTRTATLTISNSDTDEGTYTISLSGTGHKGRMFMISGNTNGNMGGISGADSQCQTDGIVTGAGASAITFKAMLATTDSTRDLSNDWVFQASTEYVDFQNTGNTITTTDTASKPTFPFTNALSVTSNVWTGLQQDYTLGPENCSNWAGTGGAGRRGTGNATDLTFINNTGGAETLTCGSAIKIVCVEQPGT